MHSLDLLSLSRSEHSLGIPCLVSYSSSPQPSIVDTKSTSPHQSQRASFSDPEPNMAEVVALVASIIAVVQLADRVTTLGYEFFGKVRGASREVAEMIATVSALKTILELLSRFVQVDENATRLPLFRSLCDPDGPLKECETLLGEIESRVRLKREHSGTIKTITWHWQWAEMAKKLKVIDRHKQTFTLALQGDIATTTLAIHDTVNEVHAFAKEGRDVARALRHDIRDSKVIKWLATTDPNSNHSAARQKWEPETGAWFLLSSEFGQWLQSKRSLWLHGIPGAGKTILCSTIIANVQSRCRSDEICAFYYFDSISGQVEKQTVSAMLSSLLAQISPATEIEPEIRQLYERCDNGRRTPTVHEMTETLFAVLRKGRRMYLILDALDECSERPLLLQVIEQIAKLEGDIHLLLTSRIEYDIRTALQSYVTVVSMQDTRVDPDIRIHIEQCLLNDPKLCKWDDKIKDEIVKELVTGAKGMYNFQCQL